MAFCGDFFQEVGLHVCENVVHGAWQCSLNAGSLPSALFPERGGGIEKQK